MYVHASNYVSITLEIKLLHFILVSKGAMFYLHTNNFSLEITLVKSLKLKLFHGDFEHVHISF